MSVSHFFGAIPSPLVSPYGGSKSLGGTAFGAPLLPRKYLFLPGLAAAIVLIAAHGASAQSGPSPAGEEVLFEQNCAVCHNNPATRAPARASLGVMSPSFIVEALTNGILKAQGANLSSNRRIALAEFLTGKKIGAEAPMGGRCNGAQPPFAPDASSTSFNGWGANVENWRFQLQPGIAAAQLRRLEPKWAFGVPGVAAMFGQPAVVGGRVFFGAQNGHVYSLDMESGCYFWDYTAGAGVRTAITMGRIAGRYAAFFGDRRGRAYAIDAATGETIWKVAADDDTAVQVTGSPALFEGRLYVPISVGDDRAAMDPKFECCRGRGAIVALDAATGAPVWKTYTLAQAQPQGKNAIGTQLFGPSGASICASPTIDAKRRILYAGTGDNHSAPATATSDAVIAFSLDTGAILWSRQLLAGDMGNGACLSVDKTNCPEPHGPDYDLGSSANLIVLDGGKRLLTIGQKSGIVWALDPDDGGRIVWQRRVGAGGPLGGVLGARRPTERLFTRQSPISRSSILCSDSRSCSIRIKAVGYTRSRRGPATWCGARRPQKRADNEGAAAPRSPARSPQRRILSCPAPSTVT